MLSRSLPACPTKGSPLRVLLGARRLADEQPFGVDVAHAGHGLPAAAAETAGDAGVDVRREVAPVERGDARDARLGVAPAEPESPPASLRSPRTALAPPSKPGGRARGAKSARGRARSGSRHGAASAALSRAGRCAPSTRAPHDDRVLARIDGGGTRVIVDAAGDGSEAFGLVQPDRGDVRRRGLRERSGRRRNRSRRRRRGAAARVRALPGARPATTDRLRICASPGESISTPYATIRFARSPTRAE